MMETDKPIQVAGVDGCRAGWVVALVSATTDHDVDAGYLARFERLWVSPHFADALSKTRGCNLVCVDIPIGLSGGRGPRSCDVEARRLLGRRASSVFTPPVRAALEPHDYPTASRIQFEKTGKKLSRQGFFIMPKIREVDHLMTRILQKRVREIHPEIAFRALNRGTPTAYNKKRVAGRRERLDLLAPVFPEAEKIVTQYRRTGVIEPDDILDALAAAWTAIQAAAGRAFALPERPEKDDEGLRMEILCPLAAAPEVTEANEDV